MSTPPLNHRLALRERPTGQSVVMYQRWRDLLFLHWEINPVEIQKTLPPGLFVDTFANRAYLGLVPFFMCDIRPRFCPAVPGLSNFLEVNVRTYVYDERGVAGVWFYSLDANQWLAVKMARLFFKLPYFYAKMAAKKETNGAVAYTTWRRNSTPALSSRFHYRGQGLRRQAEPGSLEFFLVERYILFAVPGRDQLATGQVYHPPYPLSEAEVIQWDSHLLTLAGFASPGQAPDHILYSPGVDVDVYALQKC